MSAPPPTALPGATLLSLGPEPPLEEYAHLDHEQYADTLEQALMKRDKSYYRMGWERGFMVGMGSSMVAWAIVSAVSKLFGEYEAVVKGLMIGIYIFVFAQT